TIVCGSVTPFTAVGGVRSIRPFTYSFVAGPDPPGPELAEVERLTVTPPIVTSAVALAVYSPVAKLLMVSVQVAVLPLTTGVPQVSLCDAGAGLTAVEMTKLEGATGPRAVATTVKVCVWPISFTPLGVMLTAASTYFFVAGPAERA